MSNRTPDKLVIAFDYGLKQIGVAVAQTVTRSARPLCILSAQQGVPDWSEIEKLLQDWQPAICVVGLPINMDGSDSEMAERAKKFARRLEGRFAVVVEMFDERLSSFEVRQQRKDNSYAARRRTSGSGSEKSFKSQPENKLDADAAAVILQGWLDSQDFT